MSETNELSKRWVNAVLEDLLDYVQPTKYIVASTDYNDEYKTPVLTAGKTFIIGYTNETEGIFNKLPTIIFDDFTTAIKYVDFPFKVKSSAMKILTPTCTEVNIKYVYYYMRTIRISVSTHKRYWISNYSKLPIPLPPLNEQHRIVAKLEELLSDLDNAVATLKKVKEQIKFYRLSVLASAFNGQLIVNGIIGEGTGLTKLWKWVRLGEVAEVKRGKSKHRPRNDPKLYGGDYPFIQTGEIREANGGIISRYSQTYNEVGLSQSKLWPRGTLCISIAANIGETAFLGFDACFPDSVVGVLPSKDFLNGKFINYFFMKEKGNISKLAPATAQKNINVNILQKLDVPLPPVNQQIQIVEEIETRFSETDNIENSINQSLKQAEALKQSILKKAFEGKLVPQDPNDEPASKLLKRINEEKSKLEAKQKSLKKKTNKTKRTPKNG